MGAKLRNLPEEWELLSLFCCEPTIEYPGTPWPLNILTFDVTEGISRFLCVIEGDVMKIKFTWLQNQEKHLELKLQWIHEMNVISKNGVDAMELKFQNEEMMPLNLQLRPHVQCTWGLIHKFCRG